MDHLLSKEKREDVDTVWFWVWSEGIAFKAGTLKTEQQTFYKKAKEDEEIKEKEGRNHLVAN